MGIISILLSIILFFVALKIDLKNKKKVTSWASIVPFVWLSLSLSRNLSRWLSIGKYQMVRSNDYVSILEKGNVTDQLFLSTLFLIATIILIKRKKLVINVLRENKIWFLLILYCMVSIIWSESTFISLKRFVKDLNAFLMVLIILTENNPYESFKAIVRRNIYLLIPLSIAFCKYYPAIGRYQTSSWNYIYTGVTTHKNQLGVLCLITILVLFIEIWPHLKNQHAKINRNLFLVYLLYIGLTVYLMSFAESMTSNISLLIGISIFIYKFLKKHLTHIIILISIFYLTGIDEFLINNLKTVFLGFVQRDITLSGRIDLWEAVLETQFNPIVGTGYSAFWIGDRMRELIERFIFVPKQAHNGYIEVYINLGIIGLSIFLVALFSTYKKIIASWSEEDYNLSFQMAFFAMYLIYNMTEATFIFNTSPLWFVFLYVALSNKKSYKEKGSQISYKFTGKSFHV